MAEPSPIAVLRLALDSETLVPIAAARSALAEVEALVKHCGRLSDLAEYFLMDNRDDHHFESWVDDLRQARAALALFKEGS